MNSRSGWIQEFWRIVVVILLAWAVGAVFHRVTEFLLFALLAYTFRNLFNLQRLATWLDNPRMDDIPIRFGLWGDIYSRIARVSSRREQREERLNRLLNEYAASTSALPDATVALDIDGRIRWFNEVASHSLGLLPGKDIGQPLVNLFRNPEISTFINEADYTKSLQTAAPGNATRQLEIRLAPYGDGQTLLLAQDITERLDHERMRKDFVANVSHELRTPLTVVSGFIENLRNDRFLNEEKARRPLELMEQQAARMQQIIEDLLLLARLETANTPSRHQEVSVSELLALVAEECRGLGDDVPTIELRLSSARRIRGDEKQLHSVVTNLMVNAVNHTPGAGKVSVIWEDNGRESLLEVRDSGEGIAPEHVPRLTERFYRVDAGRSRERGGTGLGLAIVKHILYRHEARLEIESQPGQGSRFTCRFPASRLSG